VSLGVEKTELGINDGKGKVNVDLYSASKALRYVTCSQGNSVLPAHLGPD